MSFIDGLSHRLRVLLRRDRYDDEMAAEARFHIELEAMHQRGAARDARDVEGAARRRFGNLTSVREEVRRVGGIEFVDRLRQDLSYAWRGLARSPGFAAAVALTLALGVGANTAVFSFLDRVLLRPPLGVPNPGEVRRLYIKFVRSDGAADRSSVGRSFSYPSYVGIRAALAGTAEVAMTLRTDSASLGLGDRAIPVRESFVTAGYLPLIVRRPAIGRFFSEQEDDVVAPSPVAVLSYALWRNAFGGSAAALGQGVSIGSNRYTIIGVAPEGFSGIDLDAVDLWLPASGGPHFRGSGKPWYEDQSYGPPIVARIPASVNERLVATRATVAERRASPTTQKSWAARTVELGPVVEAGGPMEHGPEISISMRLGGVAVIVLLIACANVANLLLARALGRRREIAVRLALGVSRPRLCAQLFTESMLLAVVGGVAAVILAAWGGAVLRRMLLPRIHWAEASLDFRAVWFTAVITLIAGVLAGFVPAVRASRLDVLESLKSGGREGGHQHSRLRGSLLVVQAALSVVLLIGAGLFVRSVRNVRAIDLGFDAHRIAIGSVYFADGQPHPEVSVALVQLASRMAQVPGVEHVALSSGAPFTMSYSMDLFVAGQDSAVRLDGEGPDLMAVTPEFFAAMGIRLIAGRAFSDADHAGTQPVAIVSERMARALWPGESPLGKCIKPQFATNPCHSVIGVVDDVHSFQLVGTPRMTYFLPPEQMPRAVALRNIVIRAAPDRAEPAAEVARKELKRLLPAATSVSFPTMDQTLSPKFRPWLLGATLFSAFGLLALVVAAIGIYSVIAFTFAQRTHEMGVRVALGAQTQDVLRLVLGDGVRTVAVGVALGVVIALALGRLVASLLYGVTARDPAVMIGAAAVLLAVGLVASVLPGWRAARVDPVTALRAD